MIRTGAFIVVGLGLAVPSMASGQTAAPQSDDKRYTFNRVDEGYLRLDGRTGQVHRAAQDHQSGHGLLAQHHTYPAIRALGGVASLYLGSHSYFTRQRQSSVPPCLMFPRWEL